MFREINSFVTSRRCFHEIFDKKVYENSVVLVLEKREIYSHQKKIRQINSSLTYLLKMLLSRNICQNNVRAKLCNFHTVKTEFP